MKGGSLVKKDPKAAMEQAEKTLETDPFNQQANMLLCAAAMAAGFPEVAAFALETVVLGNPKDTKALHELAKHYYENGQPEKAVDVYTKVAELNPADLTALKKGKDAAARASMTSGKWEEVAASGGKKDYRDLIKNKEEAISLEEKGRVVKSEEMIDQQLAELLAKYGESEENQTNVDLVRRIAGLYEQKGDLHTGPRVVQLYLRAFQALRPRRRAQGVRGRVENPRPEHQRLRDLARSIRQRRERPGRAAPAR